MAFIASSFAQENSQQGTHLLLLRPISEQCLFSFGGFHLKVSFERLGQNQFKNFFCVIGHGFVLLKMSLKNLPTKDDKNTAALRRAVPISILAAVAAVLVALERSR
jgi:hypothetical protein